ncbi:alpha/beta hydrolase [Rhodococcus globerulus]|uniref:alpha/beta hydrolase n=1 Tax=Rhodococcus globerulus TaxID=33008 RepID=UPI003016BEE7
MSTALPVSSGIRRRQVEFDVSDAIGTGEELKQCAWVFEPDRDSAIEGAILCLAGGTYDKQYWHLTVPDYEDYSFAEHMARRGFVVVTLDHLATGDSSDPTTSGNVGLRLLARGDAEVARQVTERLKAGTLTTDLEPLPTVTLFGVGHSMGACLTTIVQSEYNTYDGVVLLGYGVDITPTTDSSADAEDLSGRIEQSEKIFRSHTGTPDGATSTIVPRGPLRALFHAPDVPSAVIAADDAAQSRVPVRAASEVTTPGFVREYAERINVPVFLGLGESDVSPDPWTEPANYRASDAISLVVLPGSHHCHNFATGRRRFWDEIAGWMTQRITLIR